MYVCVYIYMYIYIHTHTYILYMLTYICTNFVCHVQISEYIKNQDIYFSKSYFWFLPNLQRLNKIMKSAKSIKSEN